MNPQDLLKELHFKAIRSSGAGGQHVNKVSSKIELTFDLVKSNSLNEEEKKILTRNLDSKFTRDLKLVLFCDDTRSQHKNKEIVINRFLELIIKGLKKPKPRKATKPTKSAIKKRLDNKKKQSEKKSSRKKPGF